MRSFRRAVLCIRLGEVEFIADFEGDAPRSLRLLRSLLPHARPMLHARWSGEALWAPLQAKSQPFVENGTCYPQAGQLLFYPGGISEPELLLPYGACHFSSKAGTLAGNHVATVRGPLEGLAAAGRMVLEHGPLETRIDIKELASFEAEK